MSQVLEASRVSTDFSQYEEDLAYRPTLGLAMVAVGMSLISLLGLFFWPLIVFAVLTLAVSGIALIQLVRSRGEYRGFIPTWIAIVLSTASAIGGSSLQAYWYATEVPEGYERISFTNDISRKGFVTENGFGRPHPDVEALNGKKVFLKGYVYPPEKGHSGLKNLIFCRDNGDCCFGGNPKLEDRIGVTMNGDKTADFVQNAQISIAGTFRINPNFQNREKEPLYLIEGDLYTPSLTSF
jgi:hypothetical protein